MIYIKGVKLLGAKTSKAERRGTIVLERIRARYERYVRVQFTRILKRTYQAFIDLDHIPDTVEIFAIIQSTHDAQKDVLARMYRAIYPEASALTTPDEDIKSMDGLLFKDRAETETYLLEQWMADNIGTMIRNLDAEDITQDLWYIDDTTVKEIRKAIAEANGNVDIFQERVQHIMGSSEYRAYRIARTETARASNVAMHISAEVYSFDRPLNKVWITVGGSTVRATHRVMDGTVIPKDDMFLVPNRLGGYDMMQYPLDGAHGASAGNVVNCRCHCAYRYAD